MSLHDQLPDIVYCVAIISINKFTFNKSFKHAYIYSHFFYLKGMCDWFLTLYIVLIIDNYQNRSRIYTSPQSWEGFFPTTLQLNLLPETRRSNYFAIPFVFLAILQHLNLLTIQHNQKGIFYLLLITQPLSSHLVFLLLDKWL